MPGISYLSQTYKPEQYVQPEDLGLMAKVLSQEQGKFDEEGKKVQNEIDQFGNLDVIKGVDKQYLNGKINNLVTGLNDLGGVNLADQNVATKIEGLGSDIYGDSNIVNAVASTRQIRSLQASYENLKTNPKLSKYYSESNEWNDNKAVNSYLSSNKVGDSYYGANTATNYVPYRDNLTKAISGIRANVTTNITSDGVSYVTQEGKVVTPERIIATAADLLLPEEKAQMERDGMYAFKDANPLALVQQSLDLNNQKLQDAQSVYSKYQTQALAAGNDPAAQQKYLDLMGQEANNINQLTSASKTIQSQGLQTYSQNPDAYKAQVYKDQFYRGLGERYGYSEMNAKVSSNPAALLQLKMQQQDDQFNQRMMFNAIKEGLGYAVDPKSGKVTLTGTKTTIPPKGKGKDPFLAAPVSIPDKNDPDLWKKTEQSFIDKNKELDVKKADVGDAYFTGYINDHPDLLQIAQSTMSGSGISLKFPGQSILEKTNGQPGLQIEDFNFDPNQPGVNVMANEFQKAHNAASDVKWNFDQAKTQVLALKQIWTNYDKLSHIDKNPNLDVSKVDPKLSSMVEQYQLIDAEQKANNAKVKGINDAISKQANLTPAKTDLYNKYTQNPKSFMINSPSTITSSGSFGQTVTSSSSQELDPRIKTIQDEINTNLEKSNLNEADLKNDYYNNISNRPAYESQIITDKSDNYDYLQGLFTSILKTNGSNHDNTYVPNDDKILQFIDSKNVNVRTIGRNQSGKLNSITADVKVGVDPTTKQSYYETISVNMEPAQAKQVGFDTNPYESLNEVAALQGSTDPLLIAAPRSDGSALVAKIRIVRDFPKDRTDQTAHPQIAMETADGIKYINIPNLTLPSTADAYATMKTYIAQFAQQGLTINQIIDQLKTGR